MNFEINLIFLIKLVFFACSKSQDKKLIISRTKRVVKMEQKALFITKSFYSS